MRRSTILLIVFMCVPSAAATEQIPDYIILDEQMCELETHWSFPSPLEVYFRQSGAKNPFDDQETISTGNYRGHVATWELSDGALYLKSITVDKYENQSYKLSDGSVMMIPTPKPTPFPLAQIFPKADAKKGVMAKWFTGIVLAKIGGHRTELEGDSYSYEYRSFAYLEFKNGKFVKQTILDRDEHWRDVREYYDRIDTDTPVTKGPHFEYMQAISKLPNDDCQKQLHDQKVKTENKVNPNPLQDITAEESQSESK